MSTKLKSKNNITLWLILCVCLAPFVLALLLFMFWRPDSLINNGELLQPARLNIYLENDNDSLDSLLSTNRGRWLLLMIDESRCADDCKKKLYWLRQLRLAQGREMDRIERVWLINDQKSPDPALIDGHQGIITLNVIPKNTSQIDNQEVLSADYIYLVDPIGNLMMRFAINGDPALLKKDIKKLLKASKGIKFKGERVGKD